MSGQAFPGPTEFKGVGPVAYRWLDWMDKRVRQLTNTTAAFTTALETKLNGIAAGAEVNVNADWNAVSGDAQILNKPTLGTAAVENYETGTFTPTFRFATLGDLSVSYVQQTGFYTRIGNLIYVFISIQFTPTYTTASGNAQIQGLPYSVGTASLQGGTLSDHTSTLAYPTSRTFPITRLTGSTTLGILCFGPSLGSSAVTITQVPTATEQRWILQLMYQT